ncbi:MAG TPA: hypothetical protein VN512_00465 [Clostridia bacterium]|nr:hypothetical protein [Clostridia bacterium]
MEDAPLRAVELRYTVLGKDAAKYPVLDLLDLRDEETAVGLDGKPSFLFSSF